jgi:putative oxidoreductase
MEEDTPREGKTMESILGRFGPQVHALTRIVVGFLFAAHGAQKLFIGLPPGVPEGMVPLLYAAGAIELVGGGLVMIGLFTGWAAFICSGQMAVAYGMAHWLQQGGFRPMQNGGEPAALYSWIFLLLATLGDGIWSVGAARSGGVRAPAT